MALRREHERQLFLAARAGDSRAREQLVERYLPLARQLARRFRVSAASREDLEQVACLALVKAVDGFDVDRETAFSSYAVPCISGALKRYFRDYGWSVRVPRELQELALRVERLAEDFMERAGRQPTVAEIAADSGFDVEDILEAREAHRALYSDSLDRLHRRGDDAEQTLLDTLGETDVALEHAIDRTTLESLLDELDPRARAAVDLYYRCELTQSEIGERLGCSQMHVSRIIRAAVAKLQAQAAGDGQRDRVAITERPGHRRRASASTPGTRSGARRRQSTLPSRPPG